MSHLRAATILALVLASIAGCGLTALPGSVDDPPPDCLIPAGTEFAFAGKTTLAELGLDDAGPYRNLPGTAYVTAEPIRAQGDPPERWWCIVFDPTAAAEEVSMSGVAAYGPLWLNDWEPPAVP